MVQAEVSFSTGILRQPGTWGKILQPPDGGIYDVNMEPGEHTALRKDMTTIAFPNFTEGLILVFGVKGYHAAGMLVSCYVAVRTQPQAYLDWQFSGQLVRFEGKEVALLAKAENDLAPIYAAIREAGYLPVERFQDTLRREGKDRTATPPKS
jgi:hypothetical protein